MSSNKYNDIARRWLGDKQESVTCFFETVDCTEHTGTRGFVRVKVDLPLLTMVLRSNAFCAQEDKESEAVLPEDMALKSEQIRAGSAGIELSDLYPTHVRKFLRVGCDGEIADEWHLNVSGDSFFIEGRQSGETLTNSARISAIELGLWLTNRQPDKSALMDGEENYRCYGGCLMYTFNDPDIFWENVLDLAPVFRTP